MRYLVTGGAGFLGSHLCELLVARGDDIVVLDDLSTGSRANLEEIRAHRNLQLVTGSVLDKLLLNDLVAECEVVVHLAAVVGVDRVAEHPLRAVRATVRGTEHVLDAAHGFRKRVLLASTADVYGANDRTLDESALQIQEETESPGSFYAAARRMNEVLALAWWQEKELPVVLARLFSIAGPRQTGAHGMVLPRLVAQALLAEDLTIDGEGDQVRSFCHVADAAQGLVGLLDHRDSHGGVYNIGSEHEVTVLQLAERVLDITGSSSIVRFVPYEDGPRKGFPNTPRTVPDAGKIRRLIGWEPLYELDALIKDVTAWVTEHGPEQVLS